MLPYCALQVMPCGSARRVPRAADERDARRQRARFSCTWERVHAVWVTRVHGICALSTLHRVTCSRACACAAQIHATAQDGLAGMAACVRGRRSATAREVERLWMMQPPIASCPQDAAVPGEQECAVAGARAAGPHCRPEGTDAGGGRRRAVQVDGGCMPVLCVRSGLHLLCRYVCVRALVTARLAGRTRQLYAQR